MNRSACIALLLLVAPHAAAWVPCEQAGITRPVPIAREAPGYPESVRAIGMEGSVEIALTVLRDGTVGWARVLRAEPRGYFEQAALEGVRNWRFEPARADGVAIECRLRTRVRFSLADTVGADAGSAADRPVPAYPAALLRDRIEGYVEVEFRRAEDGSVRDAQVVTAMPRGEFEAAALAAVRGWLPPASTDPAQRETRRFEFRLPDTTLATVPATALASAPFPMAACEGRVTGRVTLEVDTDAAGQVLRARILKAEPARIFDQTALAIARGSRLSPAYRDGQPMAATGLLTLLFDPARATCPGTGAPDHDAPPSRRPQPRVGRHDEWPVPRAGRLVALSQSGTQPVPWALRRPLAALRMHWSPR